jgi:hypothetical protein
MEARLEQCQELRRQYRTASKRQREALRGLMAEVQIPLRQVWVEGWECWASRSVIAEWKAAGIPLVLGRLWAGPRRAYLTSPGPQGTRGRAKQVSLEALPARQRLALCS